MSFTVCAEAAGHNKENQIKKIRILFVIGIFAAIVLSIAAISGRVQKSNTGKITIVTTLYPLYDFAVSIGRDKVDVSMLLPPGVEPHSFEPKPSDIAKISKAGVFIYTGKFMEPWVEDIIKGVSGSNVKIVDSSAGTEMAAAGFHDKDQGLDPHIWLNFDNAKIMVDNIAQTLAEKDAANADYYKQNANEYKTALSALDDKYKTALSDCKNKEIVYGGHYAFGYLAHRYGLQYLAAQGLSPDAEPTAHDLVQLVEQIKKNNIRYIFYEELTSPKIAETLANETQAKMLLLNAAHNITRQDFENKVSFISIMENNLKNLKIGLQCAE